MAGLEIKLQELQEKKGKKVKRETDQEKLERVQAEFRKKFPNESLGRNVLSIVGILPKASRAHDKKILREALAEKYG